MKIILMASGTRGDVQPVIAFGKALKAAGHNPLLVAGSNFVDWIKLYGLEAYPTVDTEALMQSEAGINWVESKSQLGQLKPMKAILNVVLEHSINDLLQSAKGADLLVGGFAAEPYMLAIGEKYHIPLVSAALQPYRATRSGVASVTPFLPHKESILNRWGGAFTERVTWSLMNDAIKALRYRLELPVYSVRESLQAARAIPALYAFSPQVVPPTSDTNSYTTGYWFLDETYTPPAELVQFIEAGEPPLYIGFGSMPSSDPTRLVHMMSDALRQVGARGIISRGGNQTLVNDLPDNIFIAGNVPHTWLFPQVAAVVHHGGSGTTAAALRAGKPMFIVPHMSDQPYWARRAYELGVSTKPLRRHTLTRDNVAKRLHTLLTDRTLQQRASSLGAHIRAEHGVDNAVRILEMLLQQRQFETQSTSFTKASSL